MVQLKLLNFWTAKTSYTCAHAPSHKCMDPHTQNILGSSIQGWLRDSEQLHFNQEEAMPTSQLRTLSHPVPEMLF